MNTEAAQKELARREKALAALVQEKDGLARDLEGLKTERAEAVKGLAKGDASQRKVIKDLEDKAASLSLDIEVRAALVTEAQAAVAVAQAGLEAAQAADQADLEKKLATREQEELAAICAGIAEREEKIVALFCELGIEVAALQLDEIRLEGYGGPGREKFSDLLFRLPVRVPEGVRRHGLRPLMSPGFGGQLLVWPLVKFANPPGPGPVNGRDVAMAIQERRRADWIEEFKNGRSEK